MKQDELGTRMKTYEHANRLFLTERLPVIVRLDGKAFHTFTKKMQKPFDLGLSKSMRETTRLLCENIQGAKVGFTQSDEITIFINNYENVNSEPWMGNNKSKIESITASMATAFFNREISKYGVDTLAFFDSRAFVLPKHEVINNFIWRQIDAIRNSISSVGQANFSHKELHRLNSQDIKNKLLEEKSIDWDKLPTWQQRGSVIERVKVTKTVTYNDKEHEVERNIWVVKEETPLFVENRSFVEDLV